jgi:hypothetical protein
MNAPAKPRLLRSPGPVADAFLRSRAFIKNIIGPVGSGKTMAALQAGLIVGAKQGLTVDARGIGRRKARIGVIRESYPSLKSTTLKSWFNIVPEDKGFNWSPPYTHQFAKVLKRDPETGKPTEILEMEYEFRGIGQQTVEEACRGWEINAVMIDEADLQPADLVPFLTGRVGRFSDLDPSNVVDPQIIVSMNMPDIDNHAYQLAFDKHLGELSDADMGELMEALGGRPLIETFVQPGGMEPDAENLHNLHNGRGYYVLQIAANRHKKNYVDRMVHNKPVPLMHGQPVNDEFVYTRHVREERWDKRRKLIVGIDQGYSAAAVFLQRDAQGDIRTLGEVVSLATGGKALVKISAEAFGRRVKQALLERFPGIQKDQLKLVCDPAAFAAEDRPNDGRDWVLAVQAAIGMGKIHKAKSNAAALRNEAIWKAMGKQDGYYVDPGCKHLIKAHSGGYRYQKQEMSTGELRGNLEIADTIYTHVADAEQYAALEGEHVISDIRGQPRGGGAPVVVDGNYDEFHFSGG